MIKIIIKDEKSKAMEELDQMYPEMDEPSEEASKTKPATRADKYKSMCEEEEY
jgi:hypothetical protein